MPLAHSARRRQRGAAGLAHPTFRFVHHNHRVAHGRQQRTGGRRCGCLVDGNDGCVNGRGASGALGALCRTACARRATPHGLVAPRQARQQSVLDDSAQTMRRRDTGPARRWLSECPSLPRPRCCRAARQTRRSCARLLPRPRPFCHPLLAMLHCDLEDNAFPRALLVLSARRGRVYSRLLVSRLRPERWSARVSRILKARVALAGGRKRTSRQGTRHLPTVPSTFSRSRT